MTQAANIQYKLYSKFSIVCLEFLSGVEKILFRFIEKLWIVIIQYSEMKLKYS